MLFDEKNDSYAIKRLFIFGPHEEEEKMDYSKENIEGLLRTEILDRIIDIFLINDIDQRWPDLSLMFDPKFVKFIISSDIAEHAKTKSQIPAHLNKLNKYIAECYRPLTHTTKYNVVEEDGYSSFSPLCLFAGDSKDEIKEYLKHDVNVEYTNRLLFPIFNQDNNHIFVAIVFFAQHGELEQRCNCLTLDSFFNTGTISNAVSCKLLRANGITERCLLMSASGQQQDYYRCSLFAFENIRRMLTTSNEKIIELIKSYHTSYLSAGIYEGGDPALQIISTKNVDIRAIQKKMLNYLADIALDLVFYLNPEFQAATQGLNEAQKGVALSILLESYLLPLCLKIDTKDPDDLPKRVAKEMIYETEINQDGTTVASTTVKAGLLKKLEASTRVSSTEVSEYIPPLGL